MEFVLPSLLLIALLWREWLGHRERQTLVAALRERDRLAQDERGDLLQRIQAPEQAVQEHAFKDIEPRKLHRTEHDELAEVQRRFADEAAKRGLEL